MISSLPELGSKIGARIVTEVVNSAFPIAAASGLAYGAARFISPLGLDAPATALFVAIGATACVVAKAAIQVIEDMKKEAGWTSFFGMKPQSNARHLTLAFTLLGGLYRYANSAGSFSGFAKMVGIGITAFGATSYVNSMIPDVVK